MSQEDDDARRREEERQRTMDFIVQQQAQFTADMQQMREAQAQADEKWERRWGRSEQRWERTEESIRSLLAISQIQSQQIDGLAGAQANTDRQMAETNGKLNALINVVEQFISDKRNGG